MEPPDDAVVFKALADPHRRALLDALAGRDGQRLNELCGLFPELTRFGVMKHLGVLEDAGLVVSHKVGRTKLHYLNPVPIQRVAERWIARYLQRPAAQLLDLARQLESAPREPTNHRSSHKE